jgi:hypothetical protein
MRRESKTALRAELEQLVAQYDGPINRRADRITVTCTACPARRMVTAQYLLRFGVTCLRCGSKMRLAGAFQGSLMLAHCLAFSCSDIARWPVFATPISRIHARPADARRHRRRKPMTVQCLILLDACIMTGGACFDLLGFHHGATGLNPHAIYAKAGIVETAPNATTA